MLARSHLRLTEAVQAWEAIEGQHVEGWKALAACVEKNLHALGLQLPFTVGMARKQLPVWRLGGKKPRVFQSRLALSDFAVAYAARARTWQGDPPIDKGSDPEASE